MTMGESDDTLEWVNNRPINTQFIVTASDRSVELGFVVQKRN
jgi:hypothetical protein